MLNSYYPFQIVNNRFTWYYFSILFSVLNENSYKLELLCEVDQGPASGHTLVQKKFTTLDVLTFKYRIIIRINLFNELAKEYCAHLK